jgi:hypothetical protein
MMDQLHLPPDLYRDFRNRSNADVSAWLCALAQLGRWGKKQLSVGSAEKMSSQREISETDRP